MTTRKIIIRCSALVFAFAALGFFAGIPNASRFGHGVEMEYDYWSLAFWQAPLPSVVSWGAFGLCIAICIGGGQLLLGRLRGGLLTTPLALAYMFCCSLVATLIPPLLVVLFAYTTNDHIPSALSLFIPTFGIGVIAFLIFGAATSLVRQP